MYNLGIPKYLTNKPHQFVNHCIEQLKQVTPEMKESVSRKENENEFAVQSGTGEKTYVINLGNEERIGWCDCVDFSRTRLLCKHFMAVLESGKACYDDISPNFRKNPLYNLDNHFFPDSNHPQPGNPGESFGNREDLLEGSLNKGNINI